MYMEDPFYPMGENGYVNTAVVVLSVSGEQRFLFKQVQELKKGKATISLKREPRWLKAP